MKPITKESLRRLRLFCQPFNPLDYHIHIGWFGGVCVYPRSQYSELLPSGLSHSELPHSEL